MQAAASGELGRSNAATPAWQAILERIASGQYASSSATAGSENLPADQPPSRPSLTIRISQSQAAPGPSAVTLQPEQAGAISSAILRHLARRAPASQVPSTNTSEAPSPDVDEETAAVAAERHRLTSNSVIDLQAVAQWVESSLPYLGVLAAVFLYHHCTGLFLFLWLLGGIIKTNQSIKQQIALRRDYRPGDLAGTLAYVAFNTTAVIYLTAPEQLWRYLVLRPPPQSFSVWDVLFTMVVLDSLVRFVLVLPKVLAVAAFSYTTSSRTAVRQQARLLTMLEYTSQVYRGLLGAPLWYHYLLRCTPNGVLCSVCTGVYLTLKGSALLRCTRLLAMSVALVFKRGALYGTYVGKEELMEGGGMGGACPICQDPITCGVRLDCQHVFCEECIAEWLERDRTCPMCRANIKPPGLQSFSDGTTTLLPQLF